MERKVGAAPSAEALKVFETLPYGCLVLSYDFHILSMSDIYLQLTRKDRAKITGESIFDVFENNPNFIKAVNAGMRASMEYARDRKEPHGIPVLRFDVDTANPEVPKVAYWQISHTPVLDAEGEVSYVIHDICDVTIRTLWELDLERRLEQEKETVAQTTLLNVRMQRLLDEVPAQIAAVSGPDFVFQYVNQAYKRDLVPNLDVIGCRTLDVMPLIIDEPIWEILQKAYFNGETFVETEINLPMLNEISGIRMNRYFNVVYQPIRSKEGEIVGVFSFKYDISAHVAARKELLKAHEDLVSLNEELEERVEERTRELEHYRKVAESQRDQLQILLERKDEFLSIASHELKTPLTSIKSFNQLMSRVADGQQLSTFIKKSYNNILRLEKLVNDLLDVTKINGGEMVYDMQPFDFLQMVRETMEDVQLTSKSHEIILNSDKEFEFTGDRLRLEQVIINLLDNAIKYSPGEEEVMLRVQLEEEHVTISVQDYGVGIDKAYILKLFERYYRTDNTAMRFEGLGLGLFISSEIIRRHNGTYWLESEPGQGASFYFRLPLRQESVPFPVADESKFYEEAFVKIQFDPRHWMIRAAWKGHLSFETVQRCGLKILHMIKHNGVKKLLNDNTAVQGSWAAGTEWVAKDLFPELIAAGLKYIAWVQSPSAYSQLAAEKTAELSPERLEIKFFDDLTTAETWLDTKY